MPMLRPWFLFCPHWQTVNDLKSVRLKYSEPVSYDF